MVAISVSFGVFFYFELHRVRVLDHCELGHARLYLSVKFDKLLLKGQSWCL